MFCSELLVLSINVFLLCLVLLKQVIVIYCGSPMELIKHSVEKMQGLLLLNQVVCVLTTVL